MIKLTKYLGFGGLLLGVLWAVVYRRAGNALFLALAVTCATTGYHFAVRLGVGAVFDRFMGNRADCSKGWYQVRPWENRLYERIKIKKWKDKMPTFHPDTFSPKEHTWDQIAQAMCQSELVHETNILMSFLPLLAGRWVGAFPVFLVTSLAGAGFDLLLVMMQRYNRPRILRLAAKKRV